MFWKEIKDKKCRDKHFCISYSLFAYETNQLFYNITDGEITIRLKYKCEKENIQFKGEIIKPWEKGKMFAYVEFPRVQL